MYIIQLLLLRHPLSLSLQNATKSCDGHASAIPNAIEETVNRVRTLAPFPFDACGGYHLSKTKTRTKKRKKENKPKQCNFGPAPFDGKFSVEYASPRF